MNFFSEKTQIPQKIECGILKPCHMAYTTGKTLTSYLIFLILNKVNEINMPIAFDQK